MRTFVIELGTGVDLHGQDPTRAAIKAVRDAFAHVSLPGLRQVAGVEDLDSVAIEVTLGVPPEVGTVDAARVAEQFPFGQVRVQVVPGGLLVAGDAFRPELGDRSDHILIVNAAIRVRVP
ncbi:MAG: Lin0512 family protein [Chloroflexi bacterium]|jgi:uncharacterized protein (TIGR02058 family)|nr:Lin0512 family protein [Chloroflexota bacterium]